MGGKSEIDDLKKEVIDLRETVSSLKEEIEMLTSHIKTTITRAGTVTPGEYTVFPNKDNCLEGDASWDRLVHLLREADRGLTAAELARSWGRSRSRTSEVLNKLVDDGRLVKFRDGRLIRFRAS
ncbi:MAG: MarR family transcriptional regulator [Candidatus Thorarchaeota archaeon]|nr:MAG: hypothetical protein DRP09_09525 [Candidatus Thorarchaeota archaeon]RLI58753.1 MAG: hypothetical protein DRO87_04850 [Candidatus Thorarchaeota archaeon]